MKTLLAPLFFLAGAAFAAPQANIDLGCTVTQKIQPDGTIKSVDCKGRVTTQAVAASTPGKRASLPSPEINLPAESTAAYENQSLGYAQKVFDWQYKSSMVIFFVVILLVVVGLAFAGIQFAIAMKTPLKPGPKGKQAAGEAGAPAASRDTTFELGAHGVKITSSVIGLLILVVSIGFFYLYLVYVYPIQNIAK